MDFKTLGFVSIGVLILILVSIFVVFKINEPYKSDKRNVASNVAPMFWNWKNIKSPL